MQTNIELTEPESQGLQKVLGGLSKREYLHRCAVWGIQHPELIHDPERLKELKIAPFEHQTEKLSPEPELPDPDLIEKYENCVYKVKKHERWDDDEQGKYIRTLRDIRSLWEAGKTPNARFESAIDKIWDTLIIDEQAAYTDYRLARIKVSGLLKSYMAPDDQGYFDELANLLKKLQKVSASGKRFSEDDIKSVNRVEHLFPFYETDKTVPQLESEVLASFTDSYYDNSPFRIHDKLGESRDVVTWIMKKLEKDSKIKLNDPTCPSREWYVKVK
jgi:hypothetical protein